MLWKGKGRLTDELLQSLLPTMLRDLEELVLRVQDDVVREQVREAVRCYHAGAYRASIVMAVSAAMQDLRRRVNELVMSGAGELSALKKDVDDKDRVEAAWEMMLLDGCKRDDLISGAEHQKLGLLLKQRHLCAHPTGHRASAEEARGVIADLVDLVLARALQTGGAAVNALIEQRLALPHLMGGAPSTLVAEEITRLQPRVLPFLATKLAGAIEVGAIPQANANAVQFLAEMTRLESGPTKEASNAAWKAIGRLLGTARAAEVLNILRLAPECIGQADTTTRGRLLNLLRAEIGQRENVVLASLLVARSFISEDEKNAMLSAVCERWLPGGQYPPEKIEAAVELSAIVTWPDFQNRLGEWLVEQLGSSTYNYANAASRGFDQIPLAEREKWKEALKARTVAQLTSAAFHGAYISKSLCAKGVPESFVRAYLIEAQTPPSISLTGGQTQWLFALMRAVFDSATIQEILAEAMVVPNVAITEQQYDFRGTLLRGALKYALPELDAALKAAGTEPLWLRADDSLVSRLRAIREQPPSAPQETLVQ